MYAKNVRDMWNELTHGEKIGSIAAANLTAGGLAHLISSWLPVLSAVAVVVQIAVGVASFIALVKKKKKDETPD